MRPQRFFLSRQAIDSSNGSVLICEPQLISRISKVLRLKTGDPIIVLDGQGQLYHCRLNFLSARKIEASIVKQESAGTDPTVQIMVALPMLKGGRFEWALQKLTELGAAKIIPMVYQRSVIRTAEAAKLSHWRSILQEAAEQCERPAIPQIVEVQDLNNFLQSIEKEPIACLSLICAERYEAPSMAKLIYSQNATNLIPQSILVMVGPEGGFTTDEVNSARKLGFKLVSLGPRILRSETAAIFATALIISAAES